MASADGADDGTGYRLILCVQVFPSTRTCRKCLSSNTPTLPYCNAPRDAYENHPYIHVVPVLRCRIVVFRRWRVEPDSVLYRVRCRASAPVRLSLLFAGARSPGALCEYAYVGESRIDFDRRCCATCLLSAVSGSRGYESVCLGGAHAA